MRNGCRMVLFFVIGGVVLSLTGCEDPVASMVKSTQEAAVEHDKIEAEKEMKQMEIDLEREKLLSKERLAEIELEKQRLANESNNNSIVVPTSNTEDTKNASVDTDEDDTLAKDNGQ